MLADELLHGRRIECAVDLPGRNRPRLEVVHIGDMSDKDIVEIHHFEGFGVLHPGSQRALLDASGFHAGQHSLFLFVGRLAGHLPAPRHIVRGLVQVDTVHLPVNLVGVGMEFLIKLGDEIVCPCLEFWSYQLFDLVQGLIIDTHAFKGFGHSRIIDIPADLIPIGGLQGGESQRLPALSCADKHLAFHLLAKFGKLLGELGVVLDAENLDRLLHDLLMPFHLHALVVPGGLVDDAAEVLHGP